MIAVHIILLLKRDLYLSGETRIAHSLQDFVDYLFQTVDISIDAHRTQLPAVPYNVEIAEFLRCLRDDLIQSPVIYSDAVPKSVKLRTERRIIHRMDAGIAAAPLDALIGAAMKLMFGTVGVLPCLSIKETEQEVIQMRRDKARVLYKQYPASVHQRNEIVIPGWIKVVRQKLESVRFSEEFQ